ncbi:MAG: tetraacyldisaccharide 4'-kinase, partial [Odoribacter sp.]|nr:tetraacyldisaccharide 4'-kinase [Odoribacter sp.]
NRPIYRDKMLPLGRLRESCKSAVHRATHVIVTKCPDTLTPIDKRVIMTSLEMYPFQQLFYSKIGYGMPTKLSGEGSQVPFADWLKEVYASGASLLIVSGIASPKPFLKQIYNYFPDRHKVLNFNDHHKYCNSDLERISNELNKLSDGPKYIITTEKDAVKLSELKLPEWRENLFYVPIVVDFMQDKSILSEAVLDYVAENRAKR